MQAKRGHRHKQLCIGSVVYTICDIAGPQIWGENICFPRALCYLGHWSTFHYKILKSWTPPAKTFLFFSSYNMRALNRCSRWAKMLNSGPPMITPLMKTWMSFVGLVEDQVALSTHIKRPPFFRPHVGKHWRRQAYNAARSNWLQAGTRTGFAESETRRINRF